jgi:hypothetical protein
MYLFPRNSLGGIKDQGIYAFTLLSPSWAKILPILNFATNREFAKPTEACQNFKRTDQIWLF